MYLSCKTSSYKLDWEDPIISFLSLVFFKIQLLSLSHFLISLLYTVPLFFSLIRILSYIRCTVRESLLGVHYTSLSKMLECWNVGLPTNYFYIFFFFFNRNHFIFSLQDFIGTLTFQHSNIYIYLINNIIHLNNKRVYTL